MGDLPATSSNARRTCYGCLGNMPPEAMEAAAE
jgi:hypothetical protein